jgi:hypothetical protein
VLRRAVIALALVLVAVVAIAIWASWPITDDLGRSCGGGVFGTSVERANDDSYLDVCNGLREARQAAVETPGIVVGLALLGVGTWVAWAVVVRRNRLI